MGSYRLLTSDLHFWHPKLARVRGFCRDDGTVTQADLEAHNEAIIRNWNSRAVQDTQGWIAGDITIGSMGRVWPLLARMNGQLNIVWGNHDDGHPMHRRSHLAQAKWLAKGVQSGQPFATLRTRIGKVMVSHFPYTYEPRPDRGSYLEWRLRDEGLPLLHGHTHEPVRVTSPREIHIGLDAWDLCPVREEEALELLEGQ